MSLLRILLAFIPPVGVFVTTGVSTALFINILLTVLGYIPGVIHALWVITKYNQRTYGSSDQL